jgi:hypothetical protein
VAIRIERFVPAYALEASRALAADASHRMQHALARIRPFEIAGDFRAERAGGRRVIVGAADVDSAPVFDGHEQRARVGAIVWACAAHDVACRVGSRGIADSAGQSTL